MAGLTLFKLAFSHSILATPPSAGRKSKLPGAGLTQVALLTTSQLIALHPCLEPHQLRTSLVPARDLHSFPICNNPGKLMAPAEAEIHVTCSRLHSPAGTRDRPTGRPIIPQDPPDLVNYNSLPTLRLWSCRLFFFLESSTLPPPSGPPFPPPWRLLPAPVLMADLTRAGIDEEVACWPHPPARHTRCD